MTSSAFRAVSAAAISSSTAPRGTVRFIAVSTHGEADIVIYPDSNKLGAAERLPRGGGLRAFFSLADQVDYWHGEQPPAA